jgi:iron complex transport system ATP-binding protein
VKLELDEVSVAKGRRSVLRGVRLTLAQGEFVALVGPSGAGKSTLLRAALGLERVSSGRVLIEGRALHDYAPRERAARMGWLPQHARVSEALSVLELVAAARYRFAEARSRALGAARAALVRVNAAEHADRDFETLSGGERQRVRLAALLAQEAPLLLLDEPGSHLDPAQQFELYELFASLVAGGHGVLCVSHDVAVLSVLSRAATARVVGLADGVVRFEEALDSPALPEALGSLFTVQVSRFALGPHSWLVSHPRGEE